MRARGRRVAVSAGGAAAVTGAGTGQAAFEQYVLPEIELLLRVARSLTHHHADAEDLVQDTLIRAYRAIDRFDGRHPRAWLLTILRNTHINRGRRRRPELMRGADASEAGDRVASPDTADAAVEALFDAELETALATLSEPYRRVIEMVDVAGLTYAEAATALGVPEGTIMSRLHRARGRVREHLADVGVAPHGGEGSTT